MMNVREWALPVYTILMQLAVGTLAIFWLIRQYSKSRFGRAETEQILRYPMFVILFTIIVAMIGSHFHLSKPYLSFLSILNFHSSWLSREIVFTAVFFLSLCILIYLQQSAAYNARRVDILGWVTIILGFVTVYCMARIYTLPTQVAWNSSATILSYYKSTLLLGTLATGSLLLLGLKFAIVRQPGEYAVRAHIIRAAFRWLPLAAALAALLSISLEIFQINSLFNGDASAQASLKLWLGIYRPLFSIHLGLMFAGVGMLVFTAWVLTKNKKVVYELVTPTYIACLLVIISEILGRFLFYATHVRIGI